MPSLVPTTPLIRNAVTFAFCQTARSSRRTTATFVSKSTRDRLCRELLRHLDLSKEQMDHFADRFLEVRVVQATLLGEARVGVTDCDLTLDHAGAGRGEDLAQL